MNKYSFWLPWALLLVAGLLWFSPKAAHAESIQATSSGTTPVQAYSYLHSGQTLSWATGPAWCAAMNSWDGSYYTYVWATNASYPNGYCQATTHKPFDGWGQGPQMVNSCNPSGGPNVYPVGGVCQPVYSCPAGEGYTLSGTTCTRPDCGAGQYRQNGVCKCENGSQTGTDGTCCPAPGAGGGAAMQWCYVSAPGASSCNAGGTNGCAVRCNNVTYQSGTGAQVEIYPKLALGQACGYTGLKTPAGTGGGELSNDQLKEVNEATKNPEKAKSPEGCLASGSGYVTVNGVTTCVASGEGGTVNKVESAKSSEIVKNPNTGADETTTKETAKSEITDSNGQKSSTTTETKTNPDGSKVITTVTKTQNSDGTVTESTKVQTVPAGGGTPTTTTDKSKTEGTGSWCQSNPTDPICKKESDECKLYPERTSCLTAGTPVEGDALSSKSVGLSSLTPVSVASNATCPADINLAHGAKFSFQHFCMYAEGIRPVILALAWLAAGFFILGFKDS